MAYLPVSLPSVHKLISRPHWSCARSYVLEEGLYKEVADFLRLCIFKFQRSRAGFSNLPTLPLMLTIQHVMSHLLNEKKNLQQPTVCSILRSILFKFSLYILLKSNFSLTWNQKSQKPLKHCSSMFLIKPNIKAISIAFEIHAC